MQFIVYLIKEVNMVESPKLNKHEKELEQEILDYMEQFISHKECLALLTKASNDHKIKVLMMLSKFKRQDYVSQDVSPEMEISHETQRKIIESLLIKMAEEFKYERVYSNLIIYLSNISYFIRNASLTKLSLNA
jgi:response regulator of citrate/malate metabolism